MANLDIGLIVVACIVPVLLIFFNVVAFAHYIDPEASGGHWFTKVVILFGMLVAESSVLLLSLDVGNKSGVVGCGVWNDNCGGLDMTLLWQIVYAAIAILVIVVIPFFIFYYENDDENMGARDKGLGFFSGLMERFASFRRSLCVSFFSTLVCLVIAAIAFFVLRHYIGYTEIPYEQMSVSVTSQVFSLITDDIQFSTVCTQGICPCSVGNCVTETATLEMEVSMLIFLAACISFLGWFLFSIYTGIGFIALPMDCINAFIHRPKVFTRSEARLQKKALMNRSDELVKLGEQMAEEYVRGSEQSRNKRSLKKNSAVFRTELNRYKVLVELLDKDFSAFQLSDPENYRKHYNPLVPFFKLGFGIISIAVTLIWLIQILLTMIIRPPIHPFLNEYLRLLDDFFPLFGTLTIAFLSIYMLLAAAKGATKFGTRFFLISVHPMEPGKTLLNAFFFNLQLVLLCVLPVVQFCTDAFRQYARQTDADVLFGTQFRNIQGFKYLWSYNVFLFMILAFFVLSLIYFAIFPSDRRHLNKVMEQIRAEKAQSLKNFERKLDQQGGALSRVI